MSRISEMHPQGSRYVTLENNMKFGFELTRIVDVYEMVERPISSIFYAHVI